MKLVGLTLNKEEIVRNCVGKKDEEVGVNVEIFDPSPGEEMVDKNVLEKIREVEKREEKEKEKEKAEAKEFIKAIQFTDIHATIINAGFNSDGSPKVAIAGLFDKSVSFRMCNKKVGYCSDNSDNLGMILADVKIDLRKVFLILIGPMLALASLVMLTFKNFFIFDFSSFFIIPLAAFLLCFPCLIESNLMKYIKPPGMKKIRLSPNILTYGISTTVPSVPKGVLNKIRGKGPFAIMFEVTEGWEKIRTDPVIFRIINFNGQQFFEPVVGYDMTPLEKKSLTEL